MIAFKVDDTTTLEKLIKGATTHVVSKEEIHEEGVVCLLKDYDIWHRCSRTAQEERSLAITTWEPGLKTSATSEKKRGRIN